MKNKCLKVMTFNLKTDHLFSKKNTWKRRGGAAYSILNKYKFDIIGTQEVSGSIDEDIISSYWWDSEDQPKCSGELNYYDFYF